MPTNKYPAPCATGCGHTVPAGEGTLTKGAAGWQVAHVGPCPVALPQAEPTAPLENGFYMDGGDFYRLQDAKTPGGRRYWKQLFTHRCGEKKDGTPRYKGEWAYAGQQPFKFLTADMLLTQDEAKEFGLRYSLCIRCCKELELAESVHVGYGKTCAGHMGWWYPTKKELLALLATEADAQKVLELA